MATLLAAWPALADGGTQDEDGGVITVDGGLGLVDAGLGVPDAGNGFALDAGRSPRRSHDAALLRDGRVIVLGGYGADPSQPIAEPQIFTPWLGTWTGPLAPRPLPSLETATAMLADGRILNVGGGGAFLYDLGRDVWANITNDLDGGTSMESAGRAASSVTVLQDGRVLVFGGHESGGPTPPQLLTVLGDGWRWSSPASGSLSQRKHHTATLLRDGRVLIIGGQHPSLSITIDDVIVFDPADGSLTLVSGFPSSQPRLFHSATRLADGRVLVLGDYGRSASTAWLIDPAALTAGPREIALPIPKLFDHTATLLPGGEVLVQGGGVEYLLEVGSAINFRWTRVHDRNNGRATLLLDGTVLHTGGWRDGGVGVTEQLLGQSRTEPIPAPAAELGSPIGPRRGAVGRLLLDGRLLIVGGDQEVKPWAVVGVDGVQNERDGAMAARWNHSATLLPSGDVLVLGGSTAYLGDPLDECWLLHPDKGARPCAPMPRAVQGHQATLLADGSVLVTGGNTTAAGADTDEAWVYDYGPNQPPGGAWTRLGATMVSRRADHAQRLLPDGRVWITGGDNGAALLTEFYQPSSQAFTRGPDLLAERAHHTMSVLRGGRVLFTGGHDVPGNPLASVELAWFSPQGFGRQTLSVGLGTEKQDHVATVLPSGEVVIAGNRPGVGSQFLEVYDPFGGRLLAPRLIKELRDAPALVTNLGGEAYVLGGSDRPASAFTWRRHAPAQGANAHFLKTLQGQAVAVAAPGQDLLLFIAGPWRSASEASSGGEANSATNVPRLLLMREDNEEVLDVSYDFDPGRELFTVKIPGNIKAGVWRAWAFINGNPGGAATLVIGPREPTASVGDPNAGFGVQAMLPATAVRGPRFDGRLHVSTRPGIAGTAVSLRFTGQLDDVQLTQDGVEILPVNGVYTLRGGPSPTSAFALELGIKATGDGPRTFEVRLAYAGLEVAQDSRLVTVSIDLANGGCGCDAFGGGATALLGLLLLSTWRRPSVRRQA
jgi:hypothetical protein